MKRVPGSREHAQPAVVRALAAVAHLAGPLATLAVAAAVGRPVFWAALAAPAASGLAYRSLRGRGSFVAAHAREAFNAHLSIALYLVAAAAMALPAEAFAVAGPLLPVALLLVFVIGLNWVLFTGIAIARAGRGLAFDYPLALPFVRGRR